MPQQTDILTPVQKQLEAYNARDIDAFMAWWAEDACITPFHRQCLRPAQRKSVNAISSASWNRIFLESFSPGLLSITSWLIMNACSGLFLKDGVK